jgi:hypothetical protein
MKTKVTYKGFDELNSALDFDDLETTSFVHEREQKYNLVSIIAYLCGIWEGLFGEGRNYDIDVYNRLKNNKNARIIRNLCVVRARMEHRYKLIYDKFQEGGSVLSMSEYIPEEAVAQLRKDGVKLSQKPNTSPIEYIMQINGEIQNRINNCKSVLPEWINWNYVKEIFIMPDGTTEAGAKAAATEYYANMLCYPYKTYINIPVPHDDGNILRNDKKFVTTLYHNNYDEFSDMNKVVDVSNQIKTDLYDFLEHGDKIDMIVDCENSDVYKIISMLRNLDWEYVQRIQKIILVNDIHTNAGWKELDKCTDVPITHIMTERVLEGKSVVDGEVFGTAFSEFLEGVDRFVLLSSDSDFWALIKSFKGRANFLVMVEHMKCSPDYKEKLVDAGVLFCYLDDFYSGEESEQMKTNMLMKSIEAGLEQETFNVKAILNESKNALRIDMDEAVSEQFFKKYLKTLQINVDENGNVRFEIRGRK